MNARSELLGLLLLLACATAAAGPPATGRIVDLTHPLYEAMPYWPGGVPFRMERLVDYDQGYRLHKFVMGENTGTHVDAPAHFFRHGRTIAAIPPDELVVPAVVIDIAGKAARNADYRLTPADIRDWEARHGRIPAHSLVILNSGWHRKFGTPEAYINQDADGVMHFPGYSKEAAGLLLERDVAGIGIDTLSIDAGNAGEFGAHQVMLGAGKYQVENMANLDALPAVGASVVIGVLPVKDGTQAQARILAFLP